MGVDPVIVSPVVSAESITEFILNNWLYEPDTGFIYQEMG